MSTSTIRHVTGVFQKHRIIVTSTLTQNCQSLALGQVFRKWKIMYYALQTEHGTAVFQS